MMDVNGYHTVMKHNYAYFWKVVRWTQQMKNSYQFISHVNFWKMKVINTDKRPIITENTIAFWQDNYPIKINNLYFRKNKRLTWFFSLGEGSAKRHSSKCSRNSWPSGLFLNIGCCFITQHNNCKAPTKVSSGVLSPWRFSYNFRETIPQANCRASSSTLTSSLLSASCKFSTNLKFDYISIHAQMLHFCSTFLLI